MSSDLTRRAVLAAGCAAGAMCIAAPRALALNTAEARQIVDRMVAEIQTLINSGRTAQQMFPDFERIFRKYSDLPIIARTTLGPAARSASAAEMRAYTDAFAGYMARKYGKRFREFIGGRIEVEDARPVKTFYEVKTTTYMRGREPFEVIYLVSDRSGRDVFFDMVIEGVSLLKSEAVEVRAMLERNRGNIMALVEDLNRAG